MTLEEHARAIEAAIQAAARDGVYLDDGHGTGVATLHVNKIYVSGVPYAWAQVSLPANPIVEWNKSLA